MNAVVELDALGVQLIAWPSYGSLHGRENRPQPLPLKRGGPEGRVARRQALHASANGVDLFDLIQAQAHDLHHAAGQPRTNPSRSSSCMASRSGVRLTPSCSANWLPMSLVPAGRRPLTMESRSTRQA